MGDLCSVMPMDWLRGNVVGAGAFGTVSLAMNKANGKLFAVKSIEVREEARRELVGLENEAQILKKLDSPWIVKSLGYDLTEEHGVRMGNLFMEYMAGGSVADIIKKFGGRLDESVIRTYTRGILQGIDYLHGEGFVHCDIKGKNVLLGSSGVVKLADFGSAKRISDGCGVELRGTPLWMAPEVVRQESQGKASDIWSLGCTVVEMATGSPPWTSISHPLVAMYKIGCSDELPELPKSLSPEGLDFLDKCFRRDPDQRWSSAQLLNHPFVTEWFQDQKHVGAQSPPSTLDFNKVWDSTSSLVGDYDSLPSKPSNSPSGDVDVDVSQSPLPVTHGQWIVVKSPKHSPPVLDDVLFTDFIGGPFTHMTSTLDSHVKSDPNSVKDISSQVFSIQQIHDSRTMDSIECDSSMTTQSQHCSHALNLQATVQSIECGSPWLLILSIVAMALMSKVHFSPWNLS